VAGADDDEDEDDDEDDEDDDDEEDGGSNYDENQRAYDDGFIRFPALDRDDEMLMVQYGAGGEPESAPIFFTNNANYNLNMGLFDDPLTNEHSNGNSIIDKSET
jgi:hypothetical protein